MIAATGPETSNVQIGASVARLLFEAGAVHVSRQQPFILAAGWASPASVSYTHLTLPTKA